MLRFGSTYALAVLVLMVGGLSASNSPDGLPGRYVPFDQLDKCEQLTRRAPPRLARDVRPDDITVIAALGDSISAALVALPSPAATDASGHSGLAQHILMDNPVTLWQEYRGVSYPTGLDDGAMSLASILSHYTNLTGGSTGHHLPAACASSICGLKDEDGLNAAVSGAVVAGLKAQVEERLIPRLKALEIGEGAWKFINIGIGGNDICASCLTPDLRVPFDRSPKRFAQDIKEAVDHLRRHVPNLIVNIVGLFHISALYDLKLRSHCTLPTLPASPIPGVPSLALECSCALIPGPAGDLARAKMDRQADAYNDAIREIIREWDEEGDEKLGVMFQPGEAVDLRLWERGGLSEVDCFHPSKEGQERVAVGFWNRLTVDQRDKARPIQWGDQRLVRCLEEGDRFPVGRGSHRT